MSQTTVSPLKHPQWSEVFAQAEGRAFTDEELDLYATCYPDRKGLADAARAIARIEVAVVTRVVREVFAQYPYEKVHEYAMAKCPRDIRYVVSYAVAAMLVGEPQWFDDKLLLWLRTILQAFEFPERVRSGAGTLFADTVLEKRLAELPRQCRSIYHTYYRLRQEMSRELPPNDFSAIEPYLTQALDTLTEPY